MTTNWTAGIVGHGVQGQPHKPVPRTDIGRGINLAGSPYTSFEDMVLDALLISDHRRRVAFGTTTATDDRIAEILHDRDDN